MKKSKRLTRLVDYSSPGSPGSVFRRRRMRQLMHRLEELHRQYGRVDILDVGGTPEYWAMLPSGFQNEHSLTITLVNVYNPDVFTLPAGMNYVQGDGRNLHMFADRQFHLVHANSVIEHVGSDADRKRFADEITRVGLNWYVQTPNYWFPVEPHFLFPAFHWLPKKLKVWLLLNFSIGHFIKSRSEEEAIKVLEENRLLRKNELQLLMPGSVIVTERVLGLAKSFTAVNDLPK